MKKLTIVLVALAVVALASCRSTKSCPAYSQVEPVEQGV